jgi:hypothetical protein
MKQPSARKVGDVRDTSNSSLTPSIAGWGRNLKAHIEQGCSSYFCQEVEGKKKRWYGKKKRRQATRRGKR